MKGSKSKPKSIDMYFAAIEAMSSCAPAEVITWLRDAFDSYMEGDGPLDKCLGLSRSDYKQYINEKRNEYLRDAWLICAPEKPWLKSADLSVAVKEFVKIWPSLKTNVNPDPRWSGLRTNLFLAFKSGEVAGVLPPISQRQLHDIVTARCVTDVSALNNFLYSANYKLKEKIKDE